jgi:methionyl-tRNA formyltransferase
MAFTNIVIIGSGALLTNCLKVVLSQTNAAITCIEPGQKEFSNLQAVCNSNNVDYKVISEKAKLEQFFREIKTKTLVLSIHNSYIFSQSVLSNESLKIVNFHNSLLPKHPGRNAPTWAIYEMDEQAGITWHEVALEIDRGNIISQKSVPIDSTMTGISLTKTCVNIGFESFKEIIQSLLNSTYISTPQKVTGPIKMHYSRETPNEGILATNWPLARISAFLRSLDYGPYPVFEKPRVYFQNELQIIEKYFIQTNSSGLPHHIPAPNELMFQDNQLSIKLQITPIH